jgi:glucokinase
MKSTNSVLINNCSLDSKAIFDAAKKGDSLALEAFDFTAKVLGQALANAVAITSPQVIYLFGGLAKSGDLLMKPLRKYFEEYLMNIYKNKTTIELSGLPDEDAAILGAASLVSDIF